jgi:glycosyltransferase involved in cell wall biosynthesis
VRQALGAEVLLSKVARWDPDKCWLTAVETAALLKRRGLKPTLFARGGMEPYGREVMGHARESGLSVREVRAGASTPRACLSALERAAAHRADVVDVRSSLPLAFLRLLYRGSDCVLANSGHEPFGIVGLETMAAGGVAFTGSTGEDYAIPFVNSFVLETSDPEEVTDYVTYLNRNPGESQRIRRNARRSARSFTWDAVVQHLVRKVQFQARLQGMLGMSVPPEPLPLEVRCGSGAGQAEGAGVREPSPWAPQHVPTSPSAP